MAASPRSSTISVASNSLAFGVPAYYNDPLCAESMSSQNGRESNCPVTHNANHRSFLDVCADRCMVAPRHDIGECEKWLHHLVGMPDAGYRNQDGTSEWATHGLTLTSVNVPVAEDPTDWTTDGRAFETVRARHIAEDEGCDNHVAGSDRFHLVIGSPWDDRPDEA